MSNSRRRRQHVPASISFASWQAFTKCIDDYGVRAPSPRNHALLYPHDAGDLWTDRRCHTFLCIGIAQSLLSDNLHNQHLPELLRHFQPTWPRTPKRPTHRCNEWGELLSKLSSYSIRTFGDLLHSGQCILLLRLPTIQAFKLRQERWRWKLRHDWAHEQTKRAKIGRKTRRLRKCWRTTSWPAVKLRRRRWI